MPPDTFRLRWRAELGAAVNAIVKQGWPADDNSIARVTPGGLLPGDTLRFAALVRAEFDTLHEGNAIRFGLRTLEYAMGKRSIASRPASP